MIKTSLCILTVYLCNWFLLAQVVEQPPEAQEPAQVTTNQVATNQEARKEAELKWFNPDYRAYISTFQELIRLGDTYAKNQFRLALSNYQMGHSLILKMRENVETFVEEASEMKYLNEKWYWQTIDRKDQEARVIQRLKTEAKLKAVIYFTKAINYLDTVGNRNTRETTEFKTLLAAIYREWVIVQYDLGNLPQCIELLERYLTIDPKYEKEITPHKYLASSFGFQEKVMTKYTQGTEEERLFFKRKKNEHLLRATELRYTKDSPEYQRILEIVNKDEVVAVDPNN